jgi:DNA-binding CsgD family transcriptional regulator
MLLAEATMPVNKSLAPDLAALLAATERNWLALQPELAATRRRLDEVWRLLIVPLWPEIKAAAALWARVEPTVAARRREDRWCAKLLDPRADESDRRRAAEAIAATFPLKLSGGDRRWRAWRTLAREARKSHGVLLRELLTLGLLDAARPERLSQPCTIKLGDETRYTRQPDGSLKGRRTFRVYRDTAPITLPPDDLRQWLMRQAFKAAEQLIGVGDDPERPRPPRVERGDGAVLAGRQAQHARAALTASDYRLVLPRLSPQERQVLTAWAEGDSTAVIADTLRIDPASVRAIKSRIRKKSRQ